VVHRDIKPDNVMLSGRHALVTDFGVAKAVTEAGGRNSVTTVGVALGTPTYMAPEQATADPLLDHRVDIYAVGILAYERLTGRPPFAGLSPQQMLVAQVTQTPEPVRVHRGACPPELEAIIARCLAKRPADRWQSAEELLHALEPLTASRCGITPTQMRPAVQVPGIAASAPRRSRLIVGALVERVCDATGLCAADLVVQDISGAGRSTILRGAAGISGVNWSADGRFLAFSASMDGRYGDWSARCARWTTGIPRRTAARCSS